MNDETKRTPDLLGGDTGEIPVITPEMMAEAKAYTPDLLSGDTGEIPVITPEMAANPKAYTPDLLGGDTGEIPRITPEMAASGADDDDDYYDMSSIDALMAQASKEIWSGDSELLRGDAAELPDDDALLYAQELVDEGEDEQAFSIYSRLAKRGIAEAQYRLAQLYGRGWGVKQNATLAYTWMHAAAEAGHKMAKLDFRYYQNLAQAGGVFNEGDARRAREEATREAHAGVYAYNYCNGTGGVERDYEKALYYAKIGCSKGDRASMKLYACMLIDGAGCAKNPELALEWLRKAEKAGEPNLEEIITIAMHHLAQDYFVGQNGKPKDKSKSAHWARQSAERGKPEAMTLYGIMLFSGSGVAKDEKGGVKWLLKAAELGDKDAVGYLCEIKDADLFDVYEIPDKYL